MKFVKNLKRETVAQLLFLFGLFCFYTMWTVIQPLNASPDEGMRYQVVQYIYEHGTLPRGDEPSIINPVWGISYAFNPILPYIIGAWFMKAVSLFSAEPFVLLTAARMVNVFCGVAAAYYVLAIGKKLFSLHKALLFTVLITTLPGAVFLFSYVNTDAMALMSSAMIIYAWICGMQSRWDYKACTLLSIGIAFCALSYYNAYGFILCSIFLFGVTLLLDAKKKKEYKTFLTKGTFVCVLVLLLIGWWFGRNYMLYDGDFFARSASSACAEQHAQIGFKPSDRLTPQRDNMTLWEMLKLGYAGTNMSWIELTARSFVGRFGFLDICMEKWTEDLYIAFVAVGVFGCFWKLPKLFSIIHKKKIVEMGMFHWCMLLALMIPNVLSIYYSYTSDYQPQGRYSMPMLIPLVYFMSVGYEIMLDKLIKNAKIQKAAYMFVSICFVLLSVYVYCTVFYPAYVG